MAENSGIKRFIRPHLKEFVGYSAATSPDALKGKVEVNIEDIIKIDANENPYGCSPLVPGALARYPNYNIYPDAEQTELRKMLSGYVGAPPEMIVASCGSNLLIDLIVRLLVGEGEEVIDCPPTFDIYRFSTAVCGGELVKVPRDEKYNIDVKAIKAAITPKTKLIFLANPNNPTANLVPQKNVIRLAETGVPLLLDEAYCEFSGETAVPLVGKYDNLMVLRTFSKWAGLAGMRIGYGVFTPVIAGYLHTIKIPYNVNLAAQVAVGESLKDLEYLQRSIMAIIEERGRLSAELQKLKWLKVFPSRANFIFCQLLKGDARELKQRLQDKGILIRYFDKPGLQNAVRFSVGKPEHTDALMRELRTISSEQ